MAFESWQTWKLASYRWDFRNANRSNVFVLICEVHMFIFLMLHMFHVLNSGPKAMNTWCGTLCAFCIFMRLFRGEGPAAVVCGLAQVKSPLFHSAPSHWSTSFEVTQCSDGLWNRNICDRIFFFGHVTGVIHISTFLVMFPCVLLSWFQFVFFFIFVVLSSRIKRAPLQSSGALSQFKKL